MVLKFLYVIFLLFLFLMLKNRYEIFKKKYPYKKIYTILKKNYGKGEFISFKSDKFVSDLKFPIFENFEEQVCFLDNFYDFVFPLISTSIDKKLSFYFKKYIKNGEGPYLKGKVTIKPGDIVIDAGAYFGTFSALASALGGIVYAFEPVSKTRENYLFKIVELNKNIYVVPMALSDKIEITEITIPDVGNLPRNLGRASIINKGTGIYKEKIQTITLDRWVEEWNVPRIDFIKADIEGAERLLLKGAFNVLKNFSPKLSICIYHLPDDKEVLKELILSANPDYKIEYSEKKLYAFVEGK